MTQSISCNTEIYKEECKNVTTLEFEEQELIQSEPNNKTPKVWTISKNEEFGKILTIKCIIDLICEGEEHLWKL